MLRAVQVSSCCLAIVAGACGLEKPSRFERDLLTAKCTLVERMENGHGFMSDEEFEVGVRCDGPSSAYFPILTAADSAGYGLSSSAYERTVGSVIVFACRVTGAGGRGAVATRLENLNRMTDRTGFRFALSPADVNCVNHFPPKEDRLTDWENKNFDRTLSGD